MSEATIDGFARAMFCSSCEGMTHGDIQLALISVWEMTELDEKSPHVWVILEVKELVRKLRAENFVGAELD